MMPAKIVGRKFLSDSGDGPTVCSGGREWVAIDCVPEIHEPLTGRNPAGTLVANRLVAGHTDAAEVSESWEHSIQNRCQFQYANEVALFGSAHSLANPSRLWLSALFGQTRFPYLEHTGED
jgi:hypothetical protein